MRADPRLVNERRAEQVSGANLGIIPPSMTLSTDYPDYPRLVQREAPLGFARHFALTEWLPAGYTMSSGRDTLVATPLPPLPLQVVGEFTRADSRFRWSGSPLAQGLRELGTSQEGFAALARESFDSDALSPFELGAACSALLAPAAIFLPIVTGSGFWLVFVSEAPIDLARLSLSAVMATLRESARYCGAPEEWAAGLLAQLGFSYEPSEQGIVCRRAEEHFLLSLAGGRCEVGYGRSGSRIVASTAPSLAGLLEQGQPGAPAARQALQEAVSLDPESFEAQLQLGRVELAESQLEQAELRLLLASLLRPQDGSALSALGDCYALLDKIPQAIAVQEKILALDPANEEAQESLERLKGAL